MAMTMMQKIEGPRLSDLAVTTADYGTPLAYIHGTKRVECPCFYAEEIREEKTESKTKGGKYEEYKYYGTWAVIVADHEIRNVLRIWLDRRLAYDTTTTRPRSYIGNKFSWHVRIYLGTEDQEPDPRMVATIEDEEGPDTCPAYLGVAYIMFEEMALEPFGNRFPQVSAQAVRGPGAANYPYETKDAVLSMASAKLTKTRRRMILCDDDTLNVWDLQSRSLIVDWSGSGFSIRDQSIGVTDDGGVYGISGFPDQYIYRIGPYGGATNLGQVASFVSSWFFGGCEYVGGIICVYSYGLVQAFGAYWTGTEMELVFPGWTPQQFFEDADGNAWAIGGGTNVVNLMPFPASTPGGPQEFSFATSTSGSAFAFDNGEGQFVVLHGTTLHLVDKTTHDVITTVAVGLGGLLNVRRVFAAIRPDDKSFFLNGVDTATTTKEFSATDLSVIRTLDSFLNWKAEDTDQVLYDPLNHAFISKPQFSSRFTWRLLDRDAESSTELGDICAEVAALAGMDAGDYDFTELDQVVEGYVWTQGPAKDIVGALLEIHDSDIAPHGFQLVGKKRGQPLSGDSITSEWMIPDGSQPLYRVTVGSETDLPLRAFCTFADPSMDEQPNTAVAQRNQASIRSHREVSYDLSTLRATPDAIQPLLERALRRSWVSSVKVECSLSPLELRVEPADVRYIVVDGERLRCKAVSTVIRANRVIDSRWEVDGETSLIETDWDNDDFSPLNATFNSPGGYTQGRPAEEVFFPQETKGFVMDIPLISDAHDESAPFFYLAAAPAYSGGFWPGAGVWVSDTGIDTSYAAGFDSFTSDQPSTWGICDTALGDGIAEVLDEGNELDIILQYGTLESVTEEELLNDATLNIALVGSEIIQFRDADLISGNTYRLSGFIRGARGTEWATTGHEDAETFLLLSKAKKHGLGASEIGDEDFYKFSTLGDDLESAEVHAVEFSAASRKPYSPAHVTLQRQTNNDWRIDWLRRTRIGGSTVNGQDVPLGETSESYKVRIMDGADTLRTITATTETATYTEAQQVEDWGSAQASLSVEVVQVAPDLSLEGFVTEASA